MKRFLVSLLLALCGAAAALACGFTPQVSLLYGAGILVGFLANEIFHRKKKIS